MIYLQQPTSGSNRLFIDFLRHFKLTAIPSFGLILLLPVFKPKEHRHLFNVFEQAGIRLIQKAGLNVCQAPLFIDQNCVYLQTYNIQPILHFFSANSLQIGNRFCVFGVCVSGNLCAMSFFNGEISRELRLFDKAIPVLLILQHLRLLLLNAYPATIVKLLAHKEN